jgi:integrase/recombinase XerD
MSTSISFAIEAYSYDILSHTPKTQTWYLQKLAVFAQCCEERSIALDHLKAMHLRQFAEYLKTRVNPKTGKPISTYTQHGYFQVIKTFLKWCADEEDLESLVSAKMLKKVPQVKVDIKVIEIFSDDQVRALFEATKKEETEWLAIRDRAILSCLFDTGMRASELTGLTLEHVYITNHDAYLKIFGKGSKWREVPLGSRARIAIHKYIHRYRPQSDYQNVFLSRTKEPFSLGGLIQLFKRLGKWWHIKGVRCSPHTARHSYAINYLKNGGDVFKLSRLLGHTSVKVTENYLRAFQAKDARTGGQSFLDNLK